MRHESKTASDSRTIGICFIAPKAYPLFNKDVEEVFGGAEVDLYLLACELARDESFKVTFITADYGQKDIENISGVTVIKSLDLKKHPLCGAIRLWRAMRRSPADVYLLKTASPGVPLTAVFCLLHKKKLAYKTASSTECDGRYIKRHYLLGRAFAWSLRKAGVVFTQNVADKEDLQRTVGVSAVVLPNGHHLPPLTNQDREIVLWVGRSDPEKRPELFLDLARKVPGEQFVMICQRATGDQDYETLVTRADEFKNVQFIERVPFHEIKTYFQRAKVLVNTSRSEGFPNTFIQAAQYATPIVSLGVNPDGFLNEYNCGICCKGDVKCLSDSLRYILDGGRYVEFGTNARSYVEKNHDIINIAQRCKELFRKLV
jgi:glycosyltransferase involved in cell wall biosynthesis